MPPYNPSGSPESFERRDTVLMVIAGSLAVLALCGLVATARYLLTPSPPGPPGGAASSQLIGDHFRADELVVEGFRATAFEAEQVELMFTGSDSDIKPVVRGGSDLKGDPPNDTKPSAGLTNEG